MATWLSTETRDDTTTWRIFTRGEFFDGSLVTAPMPHPAQKVLLLCVRVGRRDSIYADGRSKLYKNLEED